MKHVRRGGVVVAVAAGMLGIAGVAAVGTGMLAGEGDRPARTEAGVRAAAYTVDGVHSGIVFQLSHDGVGTFFGRFNTISGTFSLDAAQASASSIELTIDVESVDTANSDRDKHLRSADFFNTKQFPKATFVGKSFTKNADGAWDVTGDFTLMGQTKSVTARLENVKNGTSGRTKKEIAGFMATLTIKRSEFGITKYPEGLGDEVTIMAGIEGAR